MWETFFFKKHAENEAGRLVPDCLLYIKSKQVVSTLFLIYFGIPRLGHTVKTSCKTFQTVDPEIYFDFL